MKKGERRRRKAGANNFPHSKNNNGALKISASVQKATKRKIPEQKETAPEKFGKTDVLHRQSLIFHL